MVRSAGKLKEAQTQKKRQRRQIFRGTGNPSSLESSAHLPKCLEGVLQESLFPYMFLWAPLEKDGLGILLAVKS